MFKKLGSAVGLSLLSVPAFAAVPAAITTATDAMGADALTVGVAFLVAIIGIKALHLMKRA